MQVPRPAFTSIPGRLAGRPAAGAVMSGESSADEAPRPGLGCIHLAKVANMSSTCRGLEMWSFMPQASARSRSPAMASAVMAITGSLAQRDCSRILRVAVYPSITGIWQSINTPSKSASRSSCSSACAPWKARLSSMPALSNSSHASSRFNSLSSTSNSRAPRRLAMALALCPTRSLARVSICGALPSTAPSDSSKVEGVTGLVSTTGN
ncbi:hypothetical protein D3C87_1323150 [compost metagenome]